MDKVIEDEASERELACTSVYGSKVAVTHWHTGHPEALHWSASRRTYTVKPERDWVRW